MTEKEARKELENIIEEAQINNETKIAVMKNYEEAEMLTNNEGIVVKMKDGSTFQITIVQS